MKKLLALIVFLVCVYPTFAGFYTAELVRKETTADSSVRNENPDKAFQGYIETGIATGIGKYGLDNCRLNLMAGYQFNSWLIIGLGMGLRQYK
jgi:hypothetical protein